MMSQATESRPAPLAVSNVQDVFLNAARRDRSGVVIVFMDGRRLDARIKSFDKFAVIVDVAGVDHLVFKHAIASIETSRSSADDFSADQS